MRAFAAPAFSPLFLNVFIIGCALYVSPHLPEPIIGVAIGVVAGGAAQFAMQLPSLKGRAEQEYGDVPGDPSDARNRPYPIGKLRIDSCSADSGTERSKSARRHALAVIAGANESRRPSGTVDR